MMSSKNIKEILKSISQSNQSFVILEDGQPKYVVLEYSAYDKLLKTNNKENYYEQKRETLNERVLIVGEPSQLAEGFIKKASNIFEKVFLVGYESILELANVEKIDFDSKELEKVFSEEKIDTVFFIDNQDEIEPVVEKEPLINKLKKVVGLLDGIRVGENPKFIYISSDDDFTVTGKSRVVIEKILEYYHQSFNIDSLSLRLPCVYQENSEKLDNLDAWLFKDPVSAVIAASNFRKELCIPHEETISSDGTPVVELISLEDALEAILFAQDHLTGSSGSIVCRADGIKTTLGAIIDNVLVKSGKMIITTHTALDEKWQQRQQEEVKIKKLSEYGWQLKNLEIADLLISISPDFKKENLKSIKQQVEPMEKQPISIRDLLSGRQTPFIKPHNS